MMNRIRRLLPLCALLAVPACDSIDPYQRAGMWQPTGANAINLATMVNQPRDLLRGRGTVGTPAIEAAPPVARFWAGRPAELPSASTQKAVAVSATNNQSPTGTER